MGADAGADEVDGVAAGVDDCASQSGQWPSFYLANGQLLGSCKLRKKRKLGRLLCQIFSAAVFPSDTGKICGRNVVYTIHICWCMCMECVWEGDNNLESEKQRASNATTKTALSSPAMQTYQ